MEELRRAARRAVGKVSSIRRILLFGSHVRGIPTPRSDADLVVLIEADLGPPSADRVQEVRRALGRLSCPVDLRVLSESEAAQLLAAGDPVVRVAMETGVDLLGKAAQSTP